LGICEELTLLKIFALSGNSSVGPAGGDKSMGAHSLITSSNAAPRWVAVPPLTPPPSFLLPSPSRPWGLLRAGSWVRNIRPEVSCRTPILPQRC
jgi:hypothetical protein